MLNKITLLAILLSSAIFADCSYVLNSPKISWKAFKTYEKIGVKGTFESVVFDYTKSKDLNSTLLSSHVLIKTSKVNSSHPGRDATLVQSFFNIQNVKEIKAKVLSIDEKKILVQIEMNSQIKDIPMSYTLNENNITAKAFIDLSDFRMLPSLQSINKACYDLHGGKTWQDVELELEIPFAKSCKK